MSSKISFRFCRDDGASYKLQVTSNKDDDIKRFIKLSFDFYSWSYKKFIVSSTQYSPQQDKPNVLEKNTPCETLTDKADALIDPLVSWFNGEGLIYKKEPRIVIDNLKKCGIPFCYCIDDDGTSFKLQVTSGKKEDFEYLKNLSFAMYWGLRGQFIPKTI